MVLQDTGTPDTTREITVMIPIERLRVRVSSSVFLFCSVQLDSTHAFRLRLRKSEKTDWTLNFSTLSVKLLSFTQIEILVERSRGATNYA